MILARASPFRYMCLHNPHYIIIMSIFLVNPLAVVIYPATKLQVQLPYLHPMDQQVMALTLSAVLYPAVPSPHPVIGAVMNRRVPCSG